MVTVFEMPDEWLYRDDADLRERLMDEKRLQIVCKMNEQGQIASHEKTPRRVEFCFTCAGRTLLTTAYVIDPIEQTITRED